MADSSTLNSDLWMLLAEQHEIEFAQSATAPGVIALTGAGLETTEYPARFVTTLRPSHVGRFTGLVITAGATTAALRAAVLANLSVLVVDRRGVHGHLIDRTGSLRTLTLPPSEVSPARRRGPAPWGAIAVCIELLNLQPQNQVQIAEATGLSQPRVSQLLRSLPWARRSPHGWAIADVESALDWLTEVYPPPTLVSKWATLQAPVPATLAAVEALEHGGARYAVAGPVAADELAPWERPQHTVIWVDRLLDLTASGCVPASAPQATVTLAVVEDPRALPGLALEKMKVVDPWRVWVSLHIDGHTQAADHLRAKLIATSSSAGR